MPCDFCRFSTFVYKYAFLSVILEFVVFCFIRNQKPLCSLTLTFWGSVLLIETSVWFFYFSFHFERNPRKPILYLLWLGILNCSFKGSVAREKQYPHLKKKKGICWNGGQQNQQVSGDDKERPQQLCGQWLFLSSAQTWHSIDLWPGGPPWSITPSKAFCRGYSPKENVRPPCWKLVSQ